MKYGLLALAIWAEVVATSALKASAGFTRPLPVAITIVGYGAAFFLLSLCLERLKMGAVYAIWSAAGILLISLSGAVLYRQRIDWGGWLGMGLIVAGVVVLLLFSDMDIEER